MQLMNSVGVLYDSTSPIAGWLSSTPSPAIPKSPWEHKQGQRILHHAWFMRLVEILCNLRPLLWHYLQGSFPINPLHSTVGPSGSRIWLMLRVLTRYLSNESIYHSWTTVSLSVCSLTGIFWVFGKATVPISASSPDEVITDMFKISEEMASATCHSHKEADLLSKQRSSPSGPKRSFLLF